MTQTFSERLKSLVAPPQGAPSVSVVLLTWKEERNIGPCLAALAAQTVRDFEVIVIDAASPDRTVELVRAARAGFPVPLRLEVARERISVGAARAWGTRLARSNLIAFLSADAEPDPNWIEEILVSSVSADLIFGRQIHAPNVRSVASSVRGLRYHFPESEPADVAVYASHVSAAIRKEVLQTFPFGTTPGASAIDDILLARRAERAGYRLAYNPRMVVRHHDIESVRAELTKNRREGFGLGEYKSEIGFDRALAAWGLMLLVALTMMLVIPHWSTLLVGVAILWLPALRRAWRRRGKMPAADIVAAVVASPFFDLAFLFSYVGGLIAGRRHASRNQTQGT